MPTDRVQVVLRTVDNIPANFITNTFAIDSEVGPNVPVTEAALIAFYTGLAATLLSPLISNQGHLFKWYDLPGLVPNYPWRETVWSWPSVVSGDSLPAEVAMVSSFQGTRAAGLPQSRRRGRIYFGPLRITANNNGRPSATAVANLTAATETLHDALLVSGEQRWCVWSTVDQAPVTIEDGWVDNAFDTQRRRGVAATARTVWPV